MDVTCKLRMIGNIHTIRGLLHSLLHSLEQINMTHKA